MTKKFPLVPSYDAIMKLSKLNEFSKSSKDNIAEMRMKLGLVLLYKFLFKLDSNPYLTTFSLQT